jgi:hypothetical protein
MQLTTLGLLFALACKEVGPTDNGETIEAPQVLERHQNADSAREIGFGSDFYYRAFDQTFTRNFNQLPKTGEVPAEKRPYSGYWYPERFGGTGLTLTDGTSALQKYDQAFFDGENKAVAWEKANHTVAATHPTASWAGHCNGFAASAQRHIEPFKRVVRGGVTFHPEDIKALLAEIHMSAKFFFLGGNRCEGQGQLPTVGARADATVMDVCEDINPGTLHVHIANWIGIKRHTIILDQSIDYQVWNYPLHKFEVLAANPVVRSEAVRLITGRAETNYRFNPSAASFLSVRTRLIYANALDREALDSYQEGKMEVTYILELNAAGEVVGGEWIGDSQRVHPDFLWVALEPTVGDGSKYFGNPHIDPTEVIKMWAEGAGFNPDDPPTDLLEPESVEQWGRFAAFDVFLDGAQRGVAFAGKPVTLRIERRGELAESVSIKVTLDGDAIASKQLGKSEVFSQTITAGLGIHKLDLGWQRSGLRSEEFDKTLRFVTVP